MKISQTTRRRSRKARRFVALEALEPRHLMAGNVTIYAAGDIGDESMQLLIDGVAVQSWLSVGTGAQNRQFKTFQYNAGQSLSADRVRVAFTNDLYIEGGTDRNLRVDKIVIDGVTFETEDPAVFSTGTWLPADGVTPGYRQSEYLHSEGYFQYSAGQGSLIEISAAGATGLENMSLLIDDVEVYSWTGVGGNADAGQFSTFTVRASNVVRANQIKIAFTNDVYAPPTDYNLRIDAIKIDGTKYEAEAASTYSTGTFVPQYGSVVAGYWQSEWLHSDGYFQFDNLVTKPGSLGLDTSVIATRENSGSVSIAVLRSGGSDGTVSINYKTNPGTALAGSDFRTTTGTLTFGPGEIRKTFSVPLINDTTSESPETFSVVIENPQGGATLLAPRTATVTITDDDLVLPNFTSFPSTTNLRLNGNASVTNNTLQLTPNSTNQRGTAFYNRAIPWNANTSFQTQFQFQAQGGTSGGEGLTFILQNDSRGLTALGNSGTQLGYGGITKSIAIEFDTAQSAGDPNANHISVWRNGSMSSALATVNSSIDFNSGSLVNVWVDYHGETDTLAVFVSSSTTKPAQPTLTTTVDLSSTLGNQGYFGFSAATTSLRNAHRITNWKLNLDRPTTGAPNPPTNLVNQTIVAGLTAPTALKFDPSGRNMYIAEKAGRIMVARDGVLQSTPFIDISGQTNSAGDRGLLDIAVHPNFPTTPYLYLLYTVDPPEVNQNTGNDLAGPDKTGNRAGRLIRVTANSATNYTTAVAGSEVILLGKNSTWNNFNAFVDSTVNIDAPQGGVDANGRFIQDFIASDSQSHTVASLAFGTDGALFVSIGDGASYNTVDPRATRVQSIDSLSGKVLRINPITGQGYANNPFSDGNLDSNRSKVYQTGLRNPFRITVQPGTNRLYVGDVGWTEWEEINSGTAGANFGWPYYEGANGTNQKTQGYQSLAAAQAFYASGAVVTPSLYALNHVSDGINAVVLGAYYTGDTYPTKYRDNLFFNDLGQGIVRAAKIGSAGEITSVETFATGATYVVQIVQGPDGNLYYVDLDDGIIGRWQFVSETISGSSTAAMTTLAAARADTAFAALSSSSTTSTTSSSKRPTTVLPVQTQINKTQINPLPYVVPKTIGNLGNAVLSMFGLVKSKKKTK